MKHSLLLTLMLTLCVYQLSSAGKYTDVVMGFYHSIDAGDFDRAASYLNSGIKATLPFSPVPFDLKGYRDLGMAMKAGFPDMQHRVVEITEGKGSCAYRAIFSGTNTASLQGNPPTGNRVELPFIGYWTFDKNGKVTMVDIQFDLAAFNAALMKGVPAPLNTATLLLNRFHNEVLGGKHRAEVLNEIIAPDFVGSYPVENANRAQFIEGIKGVLIGYPDIRCTIVEQHAEGNKVFTSGYWDATNTGEYMGMPATGKKVHVAFMDIWTEERGKLVRNDVVMDVAGLMAQLGDPAKAMQEKNTAVVKDIYNAFSKGDLQGLLTHLSDDIQWTDAGTAVANLHKGARYGKAAVKDFFVELNNTLDIVDFKVNEYIASGNSVVASGYYRGKVKSNGKQVATDFSMTWTFDQSGKVVRHHIYVDTDNISKALAGVNNNIGTVRIAYQDFTTGNINGILAVLSDNIIWNHPGDSRKVPFSGTFKGKDQVKKFFESVGSSIQVTMFEPYGFTQSGNTISNKLRITGKTLNGNSPYAITIDVKWTFDEKGRVLRWDGAGDMQSLENALAKS